jgi:hypothetical protein
LQKIKEYLNVAVESAFNEYGIVIACLTIGAIIGWTFKAWVADRSFRKQIELRISERDQKIEELKVLVNERLKKVVVQKQDRLFFKALKKYFKATVIIKK